MMGSDPSLGVSCELQDGIEQAISVGITDAAGEIVFAVVAFNAASIEIR